MVLTVTVEVEGGSKPAMVATSSPAATSDAAG